MIFSKIVHKFSLILLICILFIRNCNSSQGKNINFENSLAKFVQQKNDFISDKKAFVSSSATSTSSSSHLTSNSLTPCTCAIFLTGQFLKGSSEPPKGYPALVHEQDVAFPCTSAGNKQCTNRCLEMIVKHLPNSATIVCGTVDRDCHKERAYLFIQNCSPNWVNTNLSAGREYCCMDGLPYKCPIV